MTVFDWIFGSAFILFIIILLISCSFDDWSEMFGIVFTIREHALFDRYWNRNRKKRNQKNN